MSEAKLDQLVKGAPAPSTSLPTLASSVASNPPSASLAAAIQESQRPVHQPRSHSDGESYIPSSPPQIYLNLLILEASLRAQYLALYARRRQHTFFLLLLTLWLVYFTWAQFLRPREDGNGHGGSVYWVADMYEKVSFLGGLLTAILIWATGTWDRGVRWPRRWVIITNRGLRGMNLKVVVLKGPWWRQTLSYLGYVLPHRSFFFAPRTSYRFVPIDPDDEKRGAQPNGTSDFKAFSYRSARRASQPPNYREEDIAPGGDHLKLLLLPKNFSAEFRENWELYRTEYWEKENERRAELRKAVWKRERDEARGQGGLLWWTGWRGWRRAVGLDGPDGRTSDVEKMHHHHHHNGRRNSKEIGARKGKTGAESHSRSSSRSSTASGTPELDNHGRQPKKSKSTIFPTSRHGRSSSTSSSVSAASSRKLASTGVDSPDSSELSDAGTNTIKLRRRGAEPADAESRRTSKSEEARREGVEKTEGDVGNGKEGNRTRRVSIQEVGEEQVGMGRTRQRTLSIRAEEG